MSIQNQIFAEISLQTPKSIAIINSTQYKLALLKLASGFHHPWSIAVLPNGNLFITERRGQLYYIIFNNKKSTSIHKILGVPKIQSRGQGGLLDIVISPNFVNDQRVFFSYVETNKKKQSRTVLSSAIFNKKKRRLVKVKLIFSTKKYRSSVIHYGGRILILADKSLLMTIGDRGNRKLAQQLDDEAGSLIRVLANGNIPKDNPFVNNKNISNYIFSYGHRNPQGLALGIDGEIWSSEHGPRGGDELNLIKKNKNYGWPLYTYGREYHNNSPIGLGKQAKGYQSPITYWTPSPAPSGLLVYQGNHFHKWRGNIFMGSLVEQNLHRLIIKRPQKKVIHQEKIFQKYKVGRIRDVREDIMGRILIITDANNGVLYRLQKNDS